MENNTINSAPANRNLLPIIAVFIITAAAASVIVWFILNQNNKNAEINNPTGEALPTLMPTSIPSPSPTLTEINKNLKIQVLNATDINGQAATLKSELTKLGFTDVATGNSADKVTSNEIRLKAVLSSASAYFKQNVPAFATAEITELKSTSSYDAVFIIGADLGSATTTTSSPSATPTITR